MGDAKSIWALAIHDFRETIMRNELIDAGFIGDVFIWCNNHRGHERIWERLDRALINLLFQSEFSDFSVKHLIRISSDHSPLLLRFENASPGFILDLFSNGCGSITRIS